MTSTIPAAIAALVAGFAASVPDGVDVIDGQPWDARDDDYLCVGYAGDEADEAGVVAETPTARLGGQLSEVFEISNYLTVFIDRNATVAGTRARAFEVFDACTAWLAANPHLGDVVADTRLTGFSTAVNQAESGMAVRLRFTVAVIGSA